MTLNIRQERTPNFHKGRRGGLGKIDQIVIHVTEGSADSTIEWFRNPASQVSSHYMVQKDGLIVQFVAEDDEAFAQGRVYSPTAPLVVVRGDINPNYYSISIEHEGDGEHEIKGAQRESSINLIRNISTRRGIPIDRYHVVGHHEIYSLKTCPGGISVDKLVKDARTDPQPPKIVWSNYFNDYLVVTKRVSDDEWYFVQMKSLGHGQRAQTPLSQFSANKPL